MTHSADFSKILLEVAFACMACDGDIDKSEIDLIKSLEEDEQLFGLENIQDALNDLVNAINSRGKAFLQGVLASLEAAELSTEEQIAVIKTAVRTIEADDQIEYSEIRFFKLIRSKLSIGKQEILKHFPDINEDYLEQDILFGGSASTLADRYFNEQEIPAFGQIDLE